VRDIRASAEVRALIGGDKLRELHGDASARYGCWAVRQDRPHCPAQLSNRARSPGFPGVKLAHAGCADSQIIEAGASAMRTMASERTPWHSPKNYPIRLGDPEVMAEAARVLLVIMPAVIEAQNSHKDASVACLLAASQALALGPWPGLSQSLVPRTATSRWAWWIGANLVSWLIVNAVVYLLSQVLGGLNVLTGDGSIAEVYLTLIATMPLTGRMLLWVLAPSALAVPGQAEPA
jgi:hypothetical protein